MTRFRASLNVALRVVHNLFNKTVVQNYQRGARYLWKREARGDCLVILP